MSALLKRVRTEALYIWHTYPARTISYAATAIVFVAAKVGIVLPTLSVVHALAVVVPFLLAGEATHRRVTPAK